MRQRSHSWPSWFKKHQKAKAVQAALCVSNRVSDPIPGHPDSNITIGHHGTSGAINNYKNSHKWYYQRMETYFLTTLSWLPIIYFNYRIFTNAKRECINYKSHVLFGLDIKNLITIVMMMISLIPWIFKGYMITIRIMYYGVQYYIFNPLCALIS